jgi:predicted membrane protein
MKYTWYDFAGNVGVALMVLVYLLLQVGKVRSGDLRYSAMNAVGAALVLVSLSYKFNLSAFLFETFWVVISVFGMIKFLSKRRAA